ncbi:hypothetical protein [Nonomuraea sp. NPDC052265]|uniref:hypothetical protein n=1 Tax=Nonomuraea sp. NPDC052265 TaxID=3364374 RepID=UPI0037C71734
MSRLCSGVYARGDAQLDGRAQGGGWQRRGPAVTVGFGLTIAAQVGVDTPVRHGPERGGAIITGVLA